MKGISLVVPVYDEEGRLPEFFRRTDVSRFREAIFVLSGCTDGSAGLIPPGARRIVIPENRGKGFALRRGFLRARGDIVVFVDADGAFSTGQILSACRAAEKSGADLCISRRRRRFPAKRRFLRGATGTSPLTA